MTIEAAFKRVNFSDSTRDFGVLANNELNMKVFIMNFIRFNHDLIFLLSYLYTFSITNQ